MKPFTPTFYKNIGYDWIVNNLRGAKFYTLKLIYRYLQDNNFKYFCYHRLERYFHFKKKIDNVDYSWHTIERSIRFLTYELKLFKPLHGRKGKGCFEPTESYQALIENLLERRWL